MYIIYIYMCLSTAVVRVPHLKSSMRIGPWRPMTKAEAGKQPLSSPPAQENHLLQVVSWKIAGKKRLIFQVASLVGPGKPGIKASSTSRTHTNTKDHQNSTIHKWGAWVGSKLEDVGNIRFGIWYGRQGIGTSAHVTGVGDVVKIPVVAETATPQSTR